LAGVGASWLASYLDGSTVGRASDFYDPAMFLAVATFWLCPIAAIWLLAKRRLKRRDAVVLGVLTPVIASVQTLAMLPLVQ
jgi:hypothetical protein